MPMTFTDNSMSSGPLEKTGDNSINFSNEIPQTCLVQFQKDKDLLNVAAEGYLTLFLAL